MYYTGGGGNYFYPFLYVNCVPRSSNRVAQNYTFDMSAGLQIVPGQVVNQSVNSNFIIDYYFYGIFFIMLNRSSIN
jgi:hypothetical protein